MRLQLNSGVMQSTGISLMQGSVARKLVGVYEVAGGLVGVALTVLVAPSALARVPEHHRGDLLVFMVVSRRCSRSSVLVASSLCAAIAWATGSLRRCSSRRSPCGASLGRVGCSRLPLRWPRVEPHGAWALDRPQAPMVRAIARRRGPGLGGCQPGSARGASFTPRGFTRLSDIAGSARSPAVTTPQAPSVARPA